MLVIRRNNWFYKTQKACYYGKCIVSLSILVARRLMLNISVKFCQRKQAVVLTWVLHTRPILQLTWIVLRFLVCRFDVCIKIVHLVSVKRTLVQLASNIRVIVEETGLFCCCCVDLLQCIDPEWHQEVLFYVLSIRSISVVCSPRLCGPWTCFMG